MAELLDRFGMRDAAGKRLGEFSKGMRQKLAEQWSALMAYDKGLLIISGLPEGGGDLPVVFRLHAGSRTRVASVTVDAPPTPGVEASPGELRLREGEPYRVSDLARDRGSLLAAYRDAGYLQAEVTPEVGFSDDRTEAAVVLHVAPGPATTVDHVSGGGGPADQLGNHVNVRVAYHFAPIRGAKRAVAGDI